MDSTISLLVSFAAGAVSNFVFYALEARAKGGKAREWERAAQYVGSFLFLVLALYQAYSAGYLQKYAQHVAEGDIKARLTAILLLFLLGGLLYQLREKERRLYALLELAIAALTAYSSLKNLAQWWEVSAWMPIAGAVYLVVRGLDNLVVGIKAARKAAEEAQAIERAQAQAIAQAQTQAIAAFAAISHSDESSQPTPVEEQIKDRQG